MAVRHVFYLLFCLLLSPWAYSQQSPPRAETSRSKWQSEFAAYGLTEEIFNANHLSRLTSKEINYVFTTAFITGYSDGADSVKPACGPQGKDVDRSTVKLYITTPADMNAEEASAVRLRLRSFPDVRLVYSESDADMSIHFLGFQDRTEGTLRPLGYTIAYYAERPCWLGSERNKTEFDLSMDFVLQTGAALDTVVQQIVAQIDTDISEKVRKWNAAALKVGTH